MALRAPSYDATSIYFKMVDERGFLCFPDAHQLGLDVLVRVSRNVTRRSPGINATQLVPGQRCVDRRSRWRDVRRGLIRGG